MSIGYSVQPGDRVIDPKTERVGRVLELCEPRLLIRWEGGKVAKAHRLHVAYHPSPEDIASRAAEIRASWSPEEEQTRRPHTPEAVIPCLTFDEYPWRRCHA